jgi:16S rRNA (cytidine1402-2'-O)-methyltransferase
MAPSQEMGQLFIVASPIGNLDDISQRAIKTLASVDLIICEDTRHSSRLLNHLDISKPMHSLHVFNEGNKSQFLLDKLAEGLNLALISDAGTPLISDPGFPLIRLARLHGVTIVPIPGPCALVTALCAAGLPTNKFIFEGFLPAKQTARINALTPLLKEQRTLIFYEAPHRLVDTLKDMSQVFGPDRETSIAKELTKSYETFFCGPLSEMIETLSNNKKIKGEYVIMLQGAPKKANFDDKIITVIQLFLDEGMSVKKAASLTAKIMNCKKNHAYELALDRAGSA